MSALVQVIHSPQTVVTGWAIGHDPDTKGDNAHWIGSNTFKELGWTTQVEYIWPADCGMTQTAQPCGQI
jgi:hypothetical protein